jgi:photosystem II stability/assembly factor-like uncharacterized protein
MKPVNLLAFLLPFLLACQPQSHKSNEQETVLLTLNTLPYPPITSAHFRGLDVVNKEVVWASGTQGSVVRTSTGGKHWIDCRIVADSMLDFRDIEAFDSTTALALSAGYPGRIYGTTNGGKTWTLHYNNLDSSVFFNGFAFWDQQNGIAFSDPMDDHLLVIRTSDGGKHWDAIAPESLPKKLAIEAGFAASGTGIVVQNDSMVWIGLGGDEARVYYSMNRGTSWEVVNTPVLHGNASSGIYSMSFRNSNEGIAVGGAWNYDSARHTAAYTVNAGKTWTLSKGVERYRSGSCYAGKNTYLATGPDGTDISYNGGKNWQLLDTTGYNAIAMADTSNIGYAVGRNGNIVRIKLVKTAR